MRVGVNGAGGRMGSAVCSAVEAAPDLELAATVRRGQELRAFADAECDVVVDFTTAEACRTTLPWLAMHGIHAVVGTSGITDADVEEFRSVFGDGVAHCVVAPNFAISAVLMDRLAEVAAPYFDTVELIEYHHDRKIDAPSGTVLATADRIAAARGDVPWGQDPTRHETVPGGRGATTTSGIHVHSIRMRGMVAHQEVVFGAEGQTLTIRQDSYDRSSFMPGVLLACRQIAHHTGVTVGLGTLLGL